MPSEDQVETGVEEVLHPEAFCYPPLKLLVCTWRLSNRQRIIAVIPRLTANCRSCMYTFACSGWGNGIHRAASIESFRRNFVRRAPRQTPGFLEGNRLISQAQRKDRAAMGRRRWLTRSSPTPRTAAVPLTAIRPSSPAAACDRRVHALKRILCRHLRSLGRALYGAGPGFCSRHPRHNLGSGRAQLVDRRGLCRSRDTTFWNRASHDLGVDPIQRLSRCTQGPEIAQNGCFTALKQDLPHFRCRVKLRLKHPKAALALLEARNPPAHTSAA
jgi:hypothetical protein